MTVKYNAGPSPADSGKSRIYLIGYRCTGKSTSGRILARMLEYGFLDTDTRIEHRMEKSIASIVETYGWEKFRQVEKEVLFSTQQSDRIIIATGGGMVVDPENRRFMRENGVCIWLCADADTVVERLRADLKSPALRPFLKGQDHVQDTQTLLRERGPWYSELADFAVDTVSNSPREVAQKIYMKLFQPH